MLIGGLANPNLYEFIEIIQREQAATEVTIQQLEEGDRPRAKRRKGVQHEKNIKSLTNDIMAGNRSLESFLSSISFCVVSFDYYCILSKIVDTRIVRTP